MNQFLLRLMAMHMNEAGGAGGEGGGAGTGGEGGAGAQGGQAATIDFNNPEIAKAIQERVEAATAGLKTKTQELLGNIKTYKETIKGYGGKSPEEIQTMLAGIEDAEEKDLIAKGKLDEVFTRRTERMSKSHQNTLNEYEGKLTEANSRNEKLAANTIASAIKSAAAEAGALPQALADFVTRSQGKFALGDNLDVVAVDKDGNTLLDADGKTPLSPLSWAKSLRQEAPHLFTIGNGGGSQGGQGGSGTVGKLNGTAEERAAYFASKFNLQQG